MSVDYSTVKSGSACNADSVDSSLGVGLSEILKGKQSIALGGHIRPDGDCVGSRMGLYL